MYQSINRVIIIYNLLDCIILRCFRICDPVCKWSNNKCVRDCLLKQIWNTYISNLIMLMVKNQKTFRNECCEKLGITPEAFEETVLWQTLPHRHLWVGRWMWRFNRSYFAHDLALIRDVAECTNMNDLCSEMNDYYEHHPDFGFYRNLFKARISGQSLVNFASQFID